MSASAPVLTDAELARRYRTNYDIADSVDVTADQMRGHLSLEQGLTARLLSSTPETRWDTFERCYNELYEALPWLAGTGGSPDYAVWKSLVGSPGSKVYEIGSGAGGLARNLADNGYLVTATDVSRERGQRGEYPGVSWASTDGVNLDRFADPASYDTVVSDQVIEHLHPDDLPAHFSSARRLLRANGRYVFRTPHAITGPHDVSKVFGLPVPVGMHLREYTATELEQAARIAGFSRVSAVLSLPKTSQVRPSRTYLRFVIFLEQRLHALGRTRGRSVAMNLRGPLCPQVFLVADRP